MNSTPISLGEFSRQRGPAVAEQWYHAITRTGFVPLAQHQVRKKIFELTDRLGVLLSSPSPANDEARALGIDLTRLGYLQAETLAATQEVLARCLLQDVPAELADILPPRVAELLGRIAGGYMQAATDAMLTQQEQIRGALLAERQRAEHALRESEYRYRAVSELASDYAYALRFEPDGAMVREWVTEAFAHITGYRPEELDGRGGFRSIIHPDDHAVAQQHMDTIQAGQPSVCEYRIITKSGETRWLLDHTRAEFQAAWQADSGNPPSPAQAGQPIVRIIGAARDVTERKAAELALKVSEERNRILIETLPDSVTLTDLEGNLITCNQRAMVQHGVTRVEELLGKNVFDLIAPFDRERALENARRTLETGVIRDVEYTLVRPDSGQFPAELSASVVRDAQNRPQAFIAVVRDITERKRTEQAERDQRALAEALRDTAAVLTSTLDLDKVLDYLLADAERVVPHSTANVMLVDASGQSARIVRTKGFADPTVEAVVRARAYALADLAGLRRMAESGQPWMIADTQAEPDWIVFPETAWIRSYVGAPIRQRGQLVGFLNLNGDRPGIFTPAHAERLQAFADQAAVALTNARLYESACRTVEQLTRLHQADQALAMAGSLDELYREVLRRAIQFVQGHTSNLALYDNAEHLVSVAVENLPDDIVGTRVKLGEGLNGRAAQTRQMQVITNYARLDRKRRALVADGLPFVAVVAMPLVWQDRLVGSLSVTDDHERDFDATDLQLLTAFATLAAAALEQRRAMAESLAREAEARMLTTRLTQIQEEERTRIAAQLSASVGSRLAALQESIERVHAAMLPNEALHTRIITGITLLRESQDMLQSLSSDLDLKQLAEVGLDPAARQYVDRLCAAECPINLRVSGQVRRLPPEIERVTFRVLQEALTNAMRHSQATKISAHLHFAVKSLRLTVHDNGIGFEPAMILSGKKVGLADLRRQAQALKGDLTIESAREQGTQVALHLPIETSGADQKQIPVLVVTSHPIIAQGLRVELAADGELTCVGHVTDGQSAMRQVEISHPDLVLMDVRLPGQSGIETTRQIVKRYPHVRVIVFAYQPDETYMEQAYQAGAKGFLVLSDSRCDIVEALHGVLSGESPVSSALAEAWAGLSARTAAVDTGSGVTARERQVLNMIAAGYSNQAIADEMGISKRTVEVHRRNLKAKLKTKNSAQMIQAALRLGLITLKP